MKRIKRSSEDEMVYEFLRMEIESDRYRSDIEAILRETGIDRGVIENGDITSERENGLRRHVLKRFRGYRDSEIFDRFPERIEWIWTVFDNEDLSKILYIEYSYWNELSNYTGSPLEAAKTIRAGKTIYDVPNDRALNGAQMLKDGHVFPPMILLTDEDESRYIILEGHGRMTAYGLVPELFKDVSVLLGCCEREALDRWYGELPKHE